MVHVYFLLTHWLSLRYTIIFNWPTGSPYCTLASFSGQLVLLFVHCHLLLAHWPSIWFSQYLLKAHWLSLWYTTIYFWPIGCPCGAILSSFGPLALSMLLYYDLLTNWLSLWYATIFYWPSGPFLCNTIIFYWPTCCFYGTLPSSTGQLAVSLVHYHLLLAHWISLWNTTIFYWPMTLPRVILYCTGPLYISSVHYYLLLSHWLSLRCISIIYWPTGFIY